MGMYDNVLFEMDCPVCGGKVSDFQTKDRDNSLDVVLPWSVTNFYTSCDNCTLWIEWEHGRLTSETHSEMRGLCPLWRELKLGELSSEAYKERAFALKKR